MVPRGVQPYATESACLISKNLTSGGAVAGGLIQLWNDWEIQMLILFSFALQIFLFIFARARRRGSTATLRVLLWLAYLMADSTAVYTLGHLSVSSSTREQKLTVFWAPFLLVHLGSQDTITAYSLEDNQLWPRHLLNLGVQAFGVAYIIYKHITMIPTLLRFASILMSTVGMVKYAERIWALKCATLDNIRSSIKKPHDLPYYYGVLPSQRVWAQERDDEQLVLFAQGMLPLCKGGIVNFPMALTSDPIIFDWSNLNWNWNWKATFKVVEMELSLMYDILYTKAAVIHTWYGYCIRVFSMLATLVAFVLFQLSSNINCYGGTNVGITYILLIGAFIMDMVSVFSALGSTWTCNLLLNLNWSRLGLAILSLRRNFKASASNRGWSGSIGQFNLLRFGSRGTSLSNIVAKMIGLEDWWSKWYYSKTQVMSEDVKELVFKHVWQVVKKIHLPSPENDIESTPYENGVEDPMAMMPPLNEWPGFRPELYDDTARRRKKLDDAMNFDAHLQEVILTWHVFTNVFLAYRVNPNDATSSSTYLNAIKTLSDYMVFLIAIHPDTIPGFELRSLYEATGRTLCLIGSHKVNRNLVKALYAYNPDDYADPNRPLIYSRWSPLIREKPGMRVLVESSTVISHGTLYARLMVELAHASNAGKPAIISCYQKRDRDAMDKLKHLMPDLESSCTGGEFVIPNVLALILDTWVRLLVLASVRYKREAHARQINRGSELTTVVWLMEEHASVFFNQPGHLGRYREE